MSPSAVGDIAENHIPILSGMFWTEKEMSCHYVMDNNQRVQMGSNAKLESTKLTKCKRIFPNCIISTFCWYCTTRYALPYLAMWTKPYSSEQPEKRG